jgi:hypothetical protein
VGNVINESIRYLNGWFWQNHVWKVILQFLGGLYDNFELEPGLCRLSDSGNLWNAMMSTASEYLTVCGWQISEEKRKLSTAKSVRKEEYLKFFVNYQNPPLELCSSAWSENCLGEANPLPKRTIFYLDIEYYNNDSTIALLDQLAVYEALQPIYELVRETLLGYGIEHMACVSGRGYNFVCAVPSDSIIFGHLVNIGGKLEPSVIERQEYPAFKRTKRVSESSEKAHKGIM